jgi:molecular chaperone GrpE
MSESKEETTQEVKEQEVDQQQESTEQEDQLAEKYKDLDEEELRERLINREQEYHQLEQELSKTQEQHLRKAAELENYRKRVQRERSQIYETAKANALDDFLDINDDLRRTLKAAEDVEVNDTFMDGLLLVANKFEEVLNKYGVERIDEVGVPFNVDLHDAMMRKKPEDEDVGSDVVLEVIENGYRMGERTIRHAKVIVSE